MMTTGQKVAVGGAAALVATIAIIGIAEHYAHAEPSKPPNKPPGGGGSGKCPDGSAAPGGDTSRCPPPQMGKNDPDAPPGGWSYNATPSAADVLNDAALKLAAVNPCLKENEQLVRNFQAAAGLAQLNASPGWDKVSPPGTDGRYGGDAYKALINFLGYSENVPKPCYSNANPGARPSWWGAPGTYLNGP